MITYNTLRNWRFGVITHQYRETDVMRYALGCGLGADPMDVRQLQFVYEQDLKVLPSMAAVIGSPGSWWRIPETKVSWQHVLHAQQDVIFHQTLPVRATMQAHNQVTHLHGFSEHDGINDDAPERLSNVPDNLSNVIEIDLPILPQGALLYRLNGDPNPLHADPVVAKQAGFEQPIFHGLGSFGYSAHAILKSCCQFEPDALKRLALRFTSPVYPGETLRFLIWRRNARLVNFQAYSKERGVLLLDCGLAELG